MLLFRKFLDKGFYSSFFKLCFIITILKSKIPSMVGNYCCSIAITSHILKLFELLVLQFVGQSIVQTYYNPQSCLDCVMSYQFLLTNEYKCQVMTFKLLLISLNLSEILITGESVQNFDFCLINIMSEQIVHIQEICCTALTMLRLFFTENSSCLLL